MNVFPETSILTPFRASGPLSPTEGPPEISARSRVHVFVGDRLFPFDLRRDTV